MRALLDLLDGQHAGIAAGGMPEYEVMLDVLVYMTTYIDRFHHPREDVAFALAASRTPGLDEARARVEQQHAAILSSGAAVRTMLEQAFANVPVPRDVVLQVGQAYVSVLREHLAFEEALLFPTVARVLDDDDWRNIEVSFHTPDDPLFGPMVEARYQGLFEKLTGGRE